MKDWVQIECFMEAKEAQELVAFGAVHVAGKVVRDPNRVLRAGEEVRIYWPWMGVRRFYELDAARILYRDAWLFVYNKEAGIPTQPMPSDAYNNVFEATKRFLAREGVTQPYVGLHHRLDRETSGVLVMTVSPQANKALGRAFAEHRVEKTYLAWVLGIPNWDTKTIRVGIGREPGRYVVWPNRPGKFAETFVAVVYRGCGQSLVHAVPVTGRTHQIRLHLAHEGLPILGDRRYGGSQAAAAASRLLLHAWKLRLSHPVTNCELSLTASLPGDWPLPPDPAIPD
ncbi:RluA family pseudouridine synthase [Desulfosoma caldarium]|uniref:RluA family pseudouridine synthase n=1 Tax=Desulfosoma caldarium TaxID=610254 RepID=UPI001475E4C1|nr:RluA family pseudouridine synthase [Desulfosoma caldarium]